MRSALSIFLTVFVAASTGNAQVYLEFKPDLLVRQGPNECGPAAIFNAYALGNKDLRNSLDRIPGVGKWEKYRILLDKISYVPSRFEKRNRTEAASGTGYRDMQDIFTEVAKTYDTKTPYNRKNFGWSSKGDSIGELSKKAHYNIATSLAYGVPVVMGLGKYSNESRKSGHFVTAIGLSTLTHYNGSEIGGSFWLDAIDPISGNFIKLLVMELPISPDLAGFPFFLHTSPMLSFLKVINMNSSEQEKFTAIEQIYGQFE